jgi:Cytochrome c7 and related cytochrome c
VRTILVGVLVFAGGIGCRLFESNVPAASSAPVLPGQSNAVFTTARPTFAAALDDFMDRRPDPVQPIEFPHVVHAGKQIGCTEYCHESAETGPVAGLPSVRTCMICHNTIATDRPLIKQITQMREKGIDLAWQRVYGYTEQAHVRFNHAPHIRANVECSTCHGNIAEQTVAQRNVDLTMGFCVNCHRERQAPTDCLTCHF